MNFGFGLCNLVDSTKHLDERTRYVTNSVEVLSKELRNIDGDGSTYGLE